LDSPANFPSGAQTLTRLRAMATGAAIFRQTARLRPSRRMKRQEMFLLAT
jgi:hypothetical protein